MQAGKYKFSKKDRSSAVFCLAVQRREIGHQKAHVKRRCLLQIIREEKRHGLRRRVMDQETGKLTGMLAEYISYAKDCLGNQTLKFNIQEYDDYSAMLQALQEHEIDMIFYAGRNSDLAEKKGYTLTNTA